MFGISHAVNALIKFYKEDIDVLSISVMGMDNWTPFTHSTL